MLSAVTAGLYTGWMSRVGDDAETRLDANAFWATFIFALNVLLFILLGLRLPSIFEAVQDTMTIAAVIGYGALVSARGDRWCGSPGSSARWRSAGSSLRPSGSIPVTAGRSAWWSAGRE